MELPTNIQALFNHNYDGFRAAKSRNAQEAIAIENELMRLNKSYQTKITRNKKRGREFIIMLVDDGN